MPQAKVLTEKNLKIVLGTISQNRHAARNRAMVLMSIWSGMRVGELAAIRIGDVVGADGGVKDEIHLTAEKTKGDRGRTVLIGERLKKELSLYVATLKYRDGDRPFFYSQRSRIEVS